MSPPPHTPPALLLEELVEEVLLRLPPEDPAGLVHAALVCKSWCSVISGPGFRRRFREFHGAPPMLGFFLNFGIFSRFVRTSFTCPPFADRRDCKVIDARHGRVLLHSAPMGLDMRKNPLEKPFIVWDPITDHCRELPLLPGSLDPHIWNAYAAVLCAASLGGTCDHLDCHRGHFLVVLVGTRGPKTLGYAYSSETGAWSEPSSVQHPYCSANSMPSALVGNALYFLCWNYINILKYNLGTHEMSVIPLPEKYVCRRSFPMTMEGEVLGFATMVKSTLYLFSWEASNDRGAGWVESRSIELETLLPDGCEPSSLYVIGSADSIGVIFLHADYEILSVDLNSNQVTNLWEKSFYDFIFPYISFYTPAFGASTGEGPGALSST